MAPGLQQFLQAKGGIGVLTVLYEYERTFTEIESETEITSDTVQKRTEEAMELGLIESGRAKRHGRTRPVYKLSNFGEDFVEDLAVRGIVSNYRSMRNHQKKLEEQTESFALG